MAQIRSARIDQSRVGANAELRMSLPEDTSVFETIYKENRWRGSSVSGPGSTPKVVQFFLPELIATLRTFHIRTLLDAPCGDANWISALAPHLNLYLGVDIVGTLISEIVPKNDCRNMFFRSSNIISDPLPRVDAIFCRDCLVHLPFEEGRLALENFVASGSKYLISTSFPDCHENKDIVIGRWRRLNLRLEPYNLPAPLKSIRERAENPNDGNNDKSLLLWSLRDVEASLKRTSVSR
jgi:hypothetical protein